ncbi:MAG: DUF917 domain-containing protein [Clostridiales Family XIII bacterium]|nr:DUF917 domain-containing protein [Clostridiales Family XIII bacterium]
MGQIELKTAQDIDDFLTGCTFFGTGGGGNPEVGRTALNAVRAKGRSLTLTEIGAIDDDAFYCIPFFMGSIAPKSPQVLEEMQQNGFAERRYTPLEMLVNAVRNLEAHSGKKISGLMMAELGGSNSACCMAAAYEMGLPVLDADPVGRAVPEMTNGLAAVKGLDFLPAAYFDAWGNANITTYAFNYPAAERIGKKLSEAAYGEMAEAAYLMPGSDLKKILVPNTLSQSLEVGRSIRLAREAGGDPCLAGAKAAGGSLVCKGRISSLAAEDRDGYYWGSYLIESAGESADRNYKIWFKNENHILWENERVLAASPDLIIVTEAESGNPILNTRLAPHADVGVIVVPAREAYRSDAALAHFSPRSFGFDFDYKPFAADGGQSA